MNKPKSPYRRAAAIGVMGMISLMLSLAVGEWLLRALGYRPGWVPRYSNRELRPVEKLEVSDQFFADQDGVMLANPEAKHSPDCQINASGFRSEPFTKAADGKPAVLLLGDSYAWGEAARPLTESFADIIRRSGYHVFNTGIPGADPVQYGFLAEKYTPILQPDVVAVALYMGNDIHPYQPLLPFKPLFHVTDVGWLQAFDENGRWMTAEQAYNKYIGQANLAESFLKIDRSGCNGHLRKVIMKSALGTLLWVRSSKLRSSLAFERSARAAIAAPNVRSEADQKIMDEARGHLDRIRETAKRNGAVFLLFVIPVHPAVATAADRIEAYEPVFRGFSVLIPPDLKAADYVSPPNKHLSNAGHAKYARFMLDHIRRSLDNRRTEYKPK